MGRYTLKNQFSIRFMRVRSPLALTLPEVKAFMLPSLPVDRAR